jgi:hypothetical protein
MRRRIVGLLLAVSLAIPLLAADVEGKSLRDAWKAVEGKQAQYKYDQGRYIVFVNLSEPAGDAVIELAGSDCFVLAARRASPKWHTVIPYTQAELRVFK